MQTIALNMRHNSGNSELVLVQADNSYDFIRAVDRALAYNLSEYYIDNWVTLDSVIRAESFVDSLMDRMERGF